MTRCGPSQGPAGALDMWEEGTVTNPAASPGPQGGRGPCREGLVLTGFAELGSLLPEGPRFLTGFAVSVFLVLGLL